MTINETNLMPHVGELCTISCAVGVCFSNITGELVNGYGFCRYGVRLNTKDGESIIGFSYGKWALVNGKLIVHIQ